MSSKLITIYWRDIPAQVTAQKGRIREKALLEARFQHAIDRAATVAGLTDSDSYIAEWNRKTFTCEEDMAEAVAKEASKIMSTGGSMLTLTYESTKVIPNYNVMGVAKAALETSVKYLSVDLGTQNIRVNAISAGPMRTLAGAAIANARDVYNYTQANSALKRNVKLEEIGNAALYFVSDLSNAVTGEVHYVDCGFNILGMPKSNT